MLNNNFIEYMQKQTNQLLEDGLFKDERIISSPQSSLIKLKDGSEVINFCANNYLGLADNKNLINSAKNALDKHGYGMASVRFICGTQNVHKELEGNISKFLGTEDTILYSSCFDANGGLFETILSEEDAIISDALNHASIIDGIRLCKAKRFRYANNNMEELESCLKEAQNSRFRMIATDGVFSMDGVIANLPAICDLAKKYDAIVMVDDSHAVGFMGKNGKGTHEHCGVEKYIDIITGTLGKALGGASGGYTSGRKEIISWLRQRSRPYLFSNTLAPVIAETSIEVIKMLQKSSDLRTKLHENSAYFRERMTKIGFSLAGSGHPIIPVMLGDAVIAGKMAKELLAKGIYVVAFSYPVVPKGLARIRTQMSASHTKEQLDKAINAFEEIGKKLNII